MSFDVKYSAQSRKLLGWFVGSALLLLVLCAFAQPVLYVRVYGDPKDIVDDFERAKVPEVELGMFLVLSGPRISGELTKRIRNKDVERRGYMVLALGSIGGQDALPTLKEIRDNPQEKAYIREDAREAIDAINGVEGALDRRGPDESDLLNDLAIIYEIAG